MSKPSEVTKDTNGDKNENRDEKKKSQKKRSLRDEENMFTPSSVIVSRCQTCQLDWPVDYGSLCRNCSTGESEVAVVAEQNLRTICVNKQCKNLVPFQKNNLPPMCKECIDYFQKQKRENELKSNEIVNGPTTNVCGSLGLFEQVNMSPLGEFLKNMMADVVLGLNPFSLPGTISGIDTPASVNLQPTPISFIPSPIVPETSQKRRINICANGNCRAALNRTIRSVHPVSGSLVCRPCFKYYVNNGIDRRHKAAITDFDGTRRIRKPSRVCSNINCSVVLYQTTGYAHPKSGNTICRPCYKYFLKNKIDRTQRTTKAAFEKMKKATADDSKPNDNHPKCQNRFCDQKVGRNSNMRCSVCNNYLLNHNRERPEYLIMAAVRRKEAIELSIRKKYIRAANQELVMNAENTSQEESGITDANSMEMSSEKQTAQEFHVDAEDCSTLMKLRTLLTQK